MNNERHNIKSQPVFAALFGGQLFLLIYGVWARAGIYSPLLWPLSVVAGLLVVGLVFLNREEKSRIFRTMSKDPILYAAIGLLAVLLAQWMNSEFPVVLFDDNTVGFVKQPPRWRPWSVDPEEALELVHWFFPVLVTVLFVRHVFRPIDLHKMVVRMAWNAAFVAFVAIIFRFSGSVKMLGIWSNVGGDVIGPFSYSNHAGIFFYLNAALACGLMHQCLVDRCPAIRSVVWGVCLVLLLGLSFLTASRAAVLVSIGFVVLVILVFFPKRFALATRSQRVNLSISIVLVALLALSLYLTAGGGTLAREMKDTVWGTGIEKVMKDRMVQLPMALEVSKPYVLFGTGGWGFRSLAYLQIPVDEWKNWTDPGRANVHCDPIQFFSEWGLVGTLFASVILACMVKDLPKRWNDIPVSLRWVSLGLIVVVLHSLVDLPFRCPAILLEWTFILAALPRLAKCLTVRETLP